MPEEKDIAIQINGLKKRYRLGVIGGGTLQGDIQSWWARVRGKEDPNLKIGKVAGNRNETFMALDGIDLTVYKGERLGIIGHNGAGKSTLLKLLSRVTAPTEGEICIDGRISSMLEVGTGFNRELTGRENIYLNGAILGMTTAEVDSKIEQIIEFSECAKFIDTPVKRYSSGMYVKLAFAVAAHLDSEILIMDEVLAVGDMAFQQKCLGKMSDVSTTEGRTVLYVSHNMNTIRQLCDRCIVMEHGKIIFNGDVEEAISVYMNSAFKKTSYIDLLEVKRAKEYMGEKARIKSFEFIKNKASFLHDEEIEFCVKLIANQPLSNMRIRLEISYADMTKIGISESKTFSKIDEGENEFYFSYKPGILPKGKYIIALDLYGFGDNFTHQTIDHPVYNIGFEILDNEGEKLVWNHNYMGHVRLGTIVCDNMIHLRGQNNG
ncbi:MAG: ABC transporter ATP-binding protein [Clostridia bacterium]|nr:ABC transporter ATP-binding protein [Clostridia bacterium]MBR4910004.1 ABC transporter ATP-binding protein [Clostridia bacterium]